MISHVLFGHKVMPVFVQGRGGSVVHSMFRKINNYINVII